MDGSTLGLVNDLDHISLGQDQGRDFSMHVLMMDSKHETSELSSGLVLKRSISDAVERNFSNTEMDLYEACREGDIDIARALLAQNPHNLNTLDEHGQAPLHYASRHDHVPIIQLLLSYGADPAVKASMEKKMISPLHMACWFSSLGALNALLDFKPDVEDSAAFGQKPLHLAASRASVDLVKTLLTRGKANPNGKDHQNVSPLHIATQRGRLEIVNILFKYGADLSAKNDEDETAVHFAAREGHAEVLKHLFQRAAMTGISSKDLVNSENAEMKTGLQLAVEGGHVEAAKIFVEYGAEVRPLTKHNIPLHVACSMGDLQMVTFLLSQNNVTVDEQDDEGMTPILRASLSGHVDVIEHLIEKGASISPAPGSTAPSPLMCAVKRGHQQAIKFLLQHGSQIDLRDSSYRTCLHVAAYSADVYTVDIILKNGGKRLIHSVDKDDRTPLHYAAIKGSCQIVQKLLDAGARANVKDDEEKLPIVMATESGSLKCVKLLLEANPKSLHCAEYRYRTPIHFAAWEGHVHLVKFLLDQGANADQRDENHLTPLMMAARLDHWETVALLLERGAKIGAVSKNRSTAVDVAAYFGCRRIVKLLLDRGASVKSDCLFGRGCLGAAIKGSKADVCMEIVKHERWKEAIEVKDEEGFCMMKQLIEKFPEVAKIAMDKCIENSDHTKFDPAYSKTFHFVFLDPVPGEQTNAEGVRYFGPKLMLQQGHRDLILHPLTEQLMKVKRTSYKVKYLYLTSLIYLVFTVNMTGLLLCLNRVAVEKYRNSTMEFSEGFCSQGILEASRAVTAVISIVFLLAHLYRMYCERWLYWMDISNALELAAFATALITVAGRELIYDDSFSISVGVLSVMLTYLTLLTYLQSLFKAGIYVTMLFEVQRKLTLVIAVFFLLLFAFALVFHILLSRDANASRAGITLNQDDPDPFGRLDLSLLKVVDMMVGEVEYSNFFVDKTLYLPELTRFIFAMFCFMIPIAFMNLLIGLAVGDIETIQKNAELRLLAVEIEDAYSFERRLPLCLLRRFHKSSLTKYPNKKNCFWQKGFSGFLQLLSGTKDNSSLDENDCDFEQTASAFFKRMGSLEARVEQLSSRIETQTEMLEKVVMMLANREVSTVQIDQSSMDPHDHSPMEQVHPSSMDQLYQPSMDQLYHSPMDQLDQLPKDGLNQSSMEVKL